jgi:hypothetical protein
MSTLSLRLPVSLHRKLSDLAENEGVSLNQLISSTATVAAVAERRRVFRVLTTDRRDLGAIRIGPRLSQALELVP